MMKHIINFLFVFIISISLFPNVMAQNNVSNKLLSMVHSKDLFRFSAMFKSAKDNLDDWQKLYLEAWSMSVFNKCEESNRKIDEFFRKYSGNLNDTLTKLLYEARENNELKLFMYKNAAATSEFILKNYSHLMTADEKDDEVNSLVIWKACANILPQTADISGDSRIKTKRDMAGLINVPLTVNGSTEEFVFDTGANISTVSRSKALKLKLRFLDGKLKIGTSTNIKVDGEIAIADKLVIGKISFTNVLFLVVPDQSLSFAGGIYVIEGIIGLPLIKEMKELHISENEMFVPKAPTPSNLNNLALDGFMPVIMGIAGGDTLSFYFDTGARTTILYQPYYILHKIEIDKTLKEQEIVVGGAGGDIKVKGFILNKVPLGIGSSKADLENVELAAELFKNNDKYAYGNLGQDYIKQFKTMILNFESMYVDFQN